MYIYINVHLLHTYMYRVFIERFRLSIYAIQPLCALDVTYMYIYIYTYKSVSYIHIHVPSINVSGYFQDSRWTVDFSICCSCNAFLLRCLVRRDTCFVSGPAPARPPPMICPDELSMLDARAHECAEVADVDKMVHCAAICGMRHPHSWSGCVDWHSHL